jgi:hypothetical protein
VQLCVLWHPTLHKHRGSAGIYPSREPVHYGIVSELLYVFGVLVVSGQCVVIGDEKVALVFVLQSNPIVQNAVQVSKMQTACWPHARKYSLIRIVAAQASALVKICRAL